MVIRRYTRLLAVFVFAFLLLAQTAVAFGDAKEPSVDPVRDSDSYSAFLYNNTNGLPVSEANAIVQTSEGFIWIGCYAGLIRYDGNTFERLDSTHGVNSISCLYVDTQDRLWIGTNDNGVAVMEKGSFTFRGENDGLGSFKINAIEGDEAGNIYVGTTSGISMFKPDLEMITLKDKRIADVYVDSMCSGSDNLIYGTTHDGNIFILRDGNLVNYYEKDETMLPITSVYPDPEKPGWIYYGTEAEGVFHVDLKSGFKTAEQIDIAPLISVNNLMQAGDYLWVLARNGIGVIAKDGFHSIDDLPLNNSIDHMMMDYEGNLWFTSTRQGVMKITTNRFMDISARYGLGETVVNSTCMLDGQLFIGADSGLAVTDKKGVVKSVPLTSVRSAGGEIPEEVRNASDLIDLLDGVRIRSIIRDSNDRLWISTYRSYGLLCFDHGELTIFNESDGILSDQIRHVYETKDGAMLVAVSGGLNIIKDGRVIGSFDKNSGISNNETIYVCEAPNGDVLAGSNGGGIYIINSEGVSNIGTGDGLSSGVVMRIRYDENNKVFWIITGNSIAYMSEDYKVTTVKTFPYPDNLDLVEDSRGNMWILSSDGIYVVPVEDLLADNVTDPVHYGIANGLQSIVTSNSHNYLSDDGDLYISGRSGVVKVNIESSDQEINDLKMAVPFIEADGAFIYPDDHGILRIPASTRKLTVYGEVFNYSLTDPSVSYYLKGFESESNTVRRSELDPVTYTNLPGGQYSFVMELKDAIGKGSKITTVSIIKEQALYEQFWFIVAMTIALVGLIITAVLLAMRSNLRKLEEKHRQQAEKERVESELYMASRIQASVLPHEFPPFPDRSEFDLYAMMAPAREVGGDLYDFFMIDDDHLGLVIADVSGKGIPAALFMMISKAILKTYAMGGNSPAEILEKTNKEICANNQMEMFVTVWLGILELSTGKITASNAGHEYPVIGRLNEGYELVRDKHSFVLGGMETVKYSDYEMQLRPGDKLFLYTDGVPEATDVNKEMFGIERLLITLNKDKSAPVEEVLRNVREAVAEFTAGAKQFDDLTMLAVEYNGPEKNE